MGKFEELKRKAKDQIFCGIAEGEIADRFVQITVDGRSHFYRHNTDEKLIDELIGKLDKNWKEKHSTANRNAKPKAIFEYRMPDEVEELIEDRGSDSYSEEGLNKLRVKGGRVLNRETLKEAEIIAENQVKDEVEELIESRSNGTYNDISDTASEIIKALGTDSKYTYFFSQIANKLARIKNGYSVEDSLLDIAGYAKLELEKERKNEC